MSTIERIEAEIASIEAQIRPLTSRLEELRRQKRDEASRAFIAANSITRADVEMSSGAGKPYFGNVSRFMAWLRTNSDKNWAEWNGQIYMASDLINNRMPDMPATIDDLTE